MNQGDLVVCIKDFNCNQCSFNKNKTYKVMFIYKNYLAAIAPISYNRSINEKIGKYSEHYWFSFRDAIDGDFLYDYFIDLKKARKSKILKLNDISN